MFLWLALLACTPKTGDAVDDTDAVDTVPCEGAACIYDPGRSFPNGDRTVSDTIRYADILGDERVVPIAIYKPSAAPTPMPIVLLSHGGADGKDDPTNSMQHWAPTFVEAGYYTVAIAHKGRSQDNYDAVCAALEVQTDIPCAIKIGWDRPHDTAAVLDWLEASAAEHPGALDLDRIYLVGHSAGAGNALMIAGARRNFKCAQPLGHVDEHQACAEADLVSLADPRVKAVIAMSPQGPDNDGFMESSFETVDRPVLIGTGMADGEYDIGEPENRRLVFTHLPAANKYELFVNDRGAVHTLFEGNTTECENVAEPARCAEMETWVRTTALAFLDAVALARPEAVAWLASDNVETASAGTAEWQRK